MNGFVNLLRQRQTVELVKQEKIKISRNSYISSCLDMMLCLIESWLPVSICTLFLPRVYCQVTTGVFILYTTVLLGLEGFCVSIWGNGIRSSSFLYISYEFRHCNFLCFSQIFLDAYRVS